MLAAVICSCLIGGFVWLGVRFLLPDECPERQCLAAHAFGAAAIIFSAFALCILSQIVALLASLSKV